MQYRHYIKETYKDDNSLINWTEWSKIEVLRYWEVFCEGPQLTNQLCNLFPHPGIWLPRSFMEWDSSVTLDQTIVKINKIVAKSCKNSCGALAHWIRDVCITAPSPCLSYIVASLLLFVQPLSLLIK